MNKLTTDLNPCSLAIQTKANKQHNQGIASWCKHNLVLSFALPVTLGLSLCASASASAELPDPIKESLFNANIDINDISLIITPIHPENEQASNLPAVVIPESNTEISRIQIADESNTAALADRALPIKKAITQHTLSPRLTTTKTTTITSAEKIAKPQPLTTAIYHKANTPRTPASTMKLIPTFVALDMLGADFKWITEVYHTGYVTNKTLYGDLIIKGSGDPKLTHERLAMMLEQVKQSGIEHIHGNIVLDTSVFQKVGKDPAAFDNDPLRPYNASPDGMLVNFNSIEMTTLTSPSINHADAILNNNIITVNENNSTTSNLATIYYKPMLADYELPQQIDIKQGRCNSVRYSLAPTWQTNQLTFNKALPSECDFHTFYIAYPDVKDFAKRVVKQKWLELGNTLTGNVISTEYPVVNRFGTYVAYVAMDSVTHTETDSSINGATESTSTSTSTSTSASASASASATNSNKLNSNNRTYLSSNLTSSPLPLVSYPSEPLVNQIYDINHYSNNVMTEQVTLSLPVYGSNIAKLANTNSQKTVQSSNYEKAMATINHWWQSNLKTTPPNMTNGSGLCRECTVTAENLSELLTYAYAHPDFATYVNSLGVAGISGTIKAHADRLPESKAIGRAWIKTGTLSNVTAIAGYVKGLSGQDYVVVAIINKAESLDTYKARYALDTMLDWTAQH